MLRERLARLVAPDFVSGLEDRANGAESDSDKRVADIISKSDPMEPLLRGFNGVFDETRERPEDNLSEPDKIHMEMLGHYIHRDPNFHFLMDWILNTHMSAELKRAKPSQEQIVLGYQYGRAIISVTSLLKREIGRLSALYDQRRRTGDEDFDPHMAA